jgi:hypothetical protein
MHMPAWVTDSVGMAYWKAADAAQNRANARLLYRVEFALPKNLSLDQQADVTETFVERVARLCAQRSSASRVAASYAIHEGFGKNPHAHVLLSTSLLDSHPRDAKRWFMRHDPKAPARAGALKSTFMATRRWLKSVRSLWAEVGNRALRLASLPEVLDHRSNWARGLQAIPGRHFGYRGPGRPGLDVATVADIWKASRQRSREAAAAHQLALELAVQTAASQLHALVLRETDDLALWLRTIATCMISTADPQSQAANQAVLDEGQLVGVLTGQVHGDWVSLPRNGVLWLVNSATGHLMHLTRGDVYTDIDTAPGIAAFASVASLFKWAGASGAVQAAQHAAFGVALRHQGMEVPLLPMRGLDAAPGAAASRRVPPRV